MQNSTLSGNTATNGGGLYNNTSGATCASTPAVTVTNSTFSGNSASVFGGGINNNYGVLKLDASTIVSNTAPANAGGGVRSYNDNLTCTRVGSSIIAGNSGSDVSATSTTQRFSSLGYNVIGTAGSNVNFTLEFNQTQDVTNVVNPLVAPLADNGGSTWTRALLPGSPAIDRGSAACPATDQRGVARPQGAACDSGAFESRGFSLTKMGGDNQSTVINTAFAQPLSLTLNETGGNGLPGMIITFTAPASGASIADSTPITTSTDANGTVSLPVTANGVIGTYTVTADAGSVGAVDFSLTNTPVCSNAIAVQNANDTGANSLRQALADACDGGIITFNSSLNNQTLTLLSELAVSKTVTIDGTGLVVKLDGNNHSNRIINASVPITLTNLTLQNAGGSSVGTGGAVQALGGATLTSVTFQNNTANNQGGALFAGGATTITNSTFTGNQTTVFDSGVTYGGAIHFASTGTVINSTFTNNQLCDARRRDFHRTGQRLPSGYHRGQHL